VTFGDQDAEAGHELTAGPEHRRVVRDGLATRAAFDAHTLGADRVHGGLLVLEDAEQAVLAR